MPIVSSEPAALPTTVLVFSGIGVPPYSARGLTQTFAPIDQSANMRRTINGALKDISASQFQKYKSTIATGPALTDQQPPAVSGVWPGRIIIVDCIFEFCYLTSSGSAEREIVEGSAYQDGDYTFYRPRITFRVMNYTDSKDEYAAENSWSMDLEEV